VETAACTNTISKSNGGHKNGSTKHNREIIPLATTAVAKKCLEDKAEAKLCVDKNVKKNTLIHFMEETEQGFKLTKFPINTEAVRNGVNRNNPSAAVLQRTSPMTKI
jgi:hypothetical protein